MDSITASKTILEYAKVCIEIGAKEDLPETVDVILANGILEPLKHSLPESSSAKEKAISNENDPITEPESSTTQKDQLLMSNLLILIFQMRQAIPYPNPYLTNMAHLEKKESISPSVILLIKVLLHLRNLDTRFGSLPWILGGDFNIYLHHKESSDSLILGPYFSSDMIDFQELIQDLTLNDHPFFGPTYTWSNKQKDTYLARKLDRVLINSHWATSFQNSFVEFTAPGPSDHCMALAWINKENQINRPKPFKFFNFWSKHPNFLEYVIISWRQPSQGNPMQNLFLKLKRLKPCLQKLNKDNYSDISARELNDLEETEYMFLKQKTKAQWIKEGDKCTKLFHSAIASKNKRDTIRILINNEGKRLETYDDMANEIIAFFKHQLGAIDPKVHPPDPSSLRNLLQIHLSTEVTTGLIKIVTTEEIKEALFNQGNDKAPGPDGFTPFFSNIPVYKTISKILVNRITLLLLDLISLNQTAFVRGRSIIDNTLLAQELVKGYGRKNISPRCALKIDLQKAFDSLNWDFISSILKAIGLSSIFTKWIETCFKEARYSISFNGSLIGYFKGERGIRQETPYLQSFL
ncbi:uncharacterized protein LOC120202566 [Hibiscus syriacus]|uniref:uncharacterized protein LOC120202566 n=1 Tax=Hibiscus syriacus TaxID=106335 RepID=UPI0019211222|nr:uncharacterized protein LOC120202566 [Hibiscus syriacus]